ncbi:MULTISPECIES: hypothetical protein [Thalassospira]|uniref:hypothetical protein n=1 Tax=Thalassospira TaxID=168934 RepID=UPI000DEDA964|nr:MULTISPECIES: hypothetical protein [Thalassospira]MBR9900485.1 hypothetical protein [Rhodospirillales bacterium]
MSLSTSNSKLFLKTAFLGGSFLLAIILLSLEIFLRSQATDAANDQAYRDRFLNGSAPWVAFGDSHVEGGLLSSDWLDNLGQASDNLEAISGKVSLRLERGGVQGIILPADPQIFSFYRLSANQTGRIDALKSEPAIRLLILDPRYRQYLKRMFWTLLGKPLEMLKGQKGDTRHNDGQSEEGDWDRTVAIRVQLHTPVPNVSELPAADQYRNMVEQVKAQGAAVCLVRYPVSHDYLQAAQALDGFRSAEKFFKSLASSLDIPHVDLSNVLPNEIYDDPDHVPDTAMERVTELVRDRCKIHTP